MDTGPKTIDSLPTELLAHIFSFVTGAPPSASRLHDQPDPHMLKSERQDLKNSSLVSRRWRAICLPILFRHVQWAFDRWELLLVEPAQEPDPISALAPLSFIRANDLGRYVQTLTLIVGDSMHGMLRLSERSPTNLTFVSARSTLESTSGATAKPSKPIDTLLDGKTPHPEIISRAATYNGENNWVWEILFGLMDPRQFNIIASPRMLASLLSRMLFLGDSWSFKSQSHILSLSRDDRKTTPNLSQSTEGATASLGDQESDSEPGLRHRNPRTHGETCKCNQQTKRVPCTLLKMRPWTTLLLNEGSSTRVYKTYEFFLKRPPSILGALLGAEEFPNDQPLIPSSIKELEYVAIFPLSSHFNTLVRWLPPLEKLFMQLVPRNDILRNAEEMKNVLTSDLWMERNTCYSMVMRELLSHSMHGDDDDFMDGMGNAGVAHAENWKSLREFESGDAADKDAWDMAVQYVGMSRTGWRVESEGVFVRPPRGESGDGDESSSNRNSSEETAGSTTEEEGFEFFQDKLERLAFNGTDNLPVSPARHYAGVDVWEDEIDFDADVVMTNMPATVVPYTDAVLWSDVFESGW